MPAFGLSGLPVGLHRRSWRALHALTRNPCAPSPHQPAVVTAPRCDKITSSLSARIYFFIRTNLACRLTAGGRSARTGRWLRGRMTTPLPPREPAHRDWRAEVAIPLLSTFYTFDHLVSRAVRTSTHEPHYHLVPIGAVLRMRFRVRAATLAASVCHLSSIPGIAPKSRCCVHLYRTRLGTKLLFPGALLLPRV